MASEQPVGSMVTAEHSSNTAASPQLVAQGQSYGQIGPQNQAKVLGYRYINGKTYINLDFRGSGGGTGWAEFDANAYHPAAQLAPANAAPAPSAAQTIQQSLEDQVQKYKDTAGRFDAAHPFAFDEALAREAATQQNDPYYQQKLSDFIQGVTTQRSRGLQDEQNVLNDLKAGTESFTTKNTTDLNRALTASRAGVADSGLFFSGARGTQEGQITNDSAQSLNDFLTGQAQKTREAGLGYTRLNEDLTTKEAQTRRDLNTSR